MVRRPGVDFIALFEARHTRANADDCPGDIVAQDEGGAIRQNQLELAVPDFRIQEVHRGGMDLDKDVVRPHLRVGQLTCA